MAELSRPGRRKARRALALSVISAALLATGCITPPPPDTGPLAIPFGEIPVIHRGQAYSHQLVATGASGAVHWSVIAGTLPPGITLSDGGVLQGTPPDYPGVGYLGGFVRVQAVDDVDTATRLLLPTTTNDVAVQSAGVPVPEGAGIRMRAGFSDCYALICWTPIRIGADGSVAPITSAGPLDAPSGPEGRAVSADGALAVLFSGGTLAVVDTTTGATVQPLASGLTMGAGLFSPNGTYLLALSSAGGGLTMTTYRTADWSVARTLPFPAGTAGILWSPDASEIALPGFGASTFAIYSTDGSGADRSLPVSDSTCLPTDWGTTNRIALSCMLTVTTMSAVDGSAVHAVYHPTQDPFATANPRPLRGVRFSPSGAYVVFGRSLQYYIYPGDNALVYAPDVDDATITAMTASMPSAEPVPVAWS